MIERSMHLQVNNPTHALSLGEQSDLVGDDSTRVVETVVFALIPEYHQVKVRDGEGHVYALTRKTAGVELTTLQEGQRLVCRVTREFPRVLTAEAVA